MTERKPPGVIWQTWIDRQIEEGQAHGAFDELPGHGKPIRGLEKPRDEMWWVRDKLRREGVETWRRRPRPAASSCERTAEAEPVPQQHPRRTIGTRVRRLLGRTDDSQQSKTDQRDRRRTLR